MTGWFADASPNCRRGIWGFSAGLGQDCLKVHDCYSGFKKRLQCQTRSCRKDRAVGTILGRLPSRAHFIHELPRIKVISGPRCIPRRHTSTPDPPWTPALVLSEGPLQLFRFVPEEVKAFAIIVTNLPLSTPTSFPQTQPHRPPSRRELPKSLVMRLLWQRRSSPFPILSYLRASSGKRRSG